MNYNPKDAVLCWPEGDYAVTLEKVVEGVSKSSGNEMLTLHWQVWSASGSSITIKDYIVNPSTLYKLKQLAKAVGRGAEFDAGTFQAESCIGCNMVAELIVEEQDGYDDQNRIKKIKARKVEESAAPVQAGGAAQKFNEAKSRTIENPIPATGGVPESEIPF